MAYQSNMEVLRDTLTLEGLRVLDVGSGAGPLVRYMTKHGASAVGLECGAAQLAKAHATDAQGDEEYVEAFGQDMPFDDASFDAVIFFNSLHHIPAEFMDAALAEAARVVRPNGTVYIAEPVAEGPSFEMYTPVDDETVVRAQADEAIGRVPPGMLIHDKTILYDTVHHYTDYEEVREEGMRISPDRAAAFEQNDALMRANFEKYGVLDEDGYGFEQPMRVNVLHKPG
ncbi:MAG: class I SAM-dependent methyltransferase [Rhodospirillales bacterium]|nr:class I SAM-dependent methyltransferase [Rhodospirillales bacterium]MBT4039173.1 class I SAM-dependent methyltransferase [Rhodospirillales bacterium]MBT4625586.1 class I SAM-dependent methyltransferase [Rhodospirillales bacterium]MBT5351024.1 class I SAM-dependent methyltransferase [Rhodospirillales bacterium]MBT5521416.1 class I SAM-dependent methyltransferase [Rhodospirillales bacterium]